MKVQAEVFRAPMRSRSLEVDRFRGARCSVEKAVVGIGEPLVRSPRTLSEALVKTAAEHGEKAARMLRRFAALPDPALVWCQTGSEEFRLGMIDGPWRYDSSPAAEATGIRNVRPARWLSTRFEVGSTPPRVIRAFERGGRNFQAIRDADAARQSWCLWHDHE